MSSGYADCKCLDCFELVVVSDTRKPEFCDACKDAGCEENQECQVLSDLDLDLDGYVAEIEHGPAKPEKA